MQPTPWFGTLNLSDFDVPIGGAPHGVATVSYHAPTVAGGRTGSLAVAGAALGLAHPGCLDCLERDRLDLALGAADANTRGAPLARPGARCAQSRGADDALVDPPPDAPALRLCQTAWMRRLSGAGRGDCRESLRQALELGGQGLLVQRQAHGLRYGDRGAGVVFVRWALAHSSRLSALAAQAEVSRQQLPHQAGIGRAAA